MHFILGLLGFAGICYLVGIIFFNKEQDPAAKFRKGLITTLILIVLTGLTIYLVYQYKEKKEKEQRHAALKKQIEEVQTQSNNNISNEVVESFDYCNNLNNAKFTSVGSYYIRLYNQEGDDFEFTGEIEGHDINGKARKIGNNFKILSGNVTGKFTLIDNCMNLTGNFKTKKYSYDISFDYTRAK